MKLSLGKYSIDFLPVLATTFVLIAVVPLSAFLADLMASRISWFIAFLPWPILFGISVVVLNKKQIRNDNRIVAYIMIPILTAVLFDVCQFIFLRAWDNNTWLYDEPVSPEHEAHERTGFYIECFAFVVAGVFLPILYRLFMRIDAMLFSILACTATSLLARFIFASHLSFLLKYYLLIIFSITAPIEFIISWQIFVGIAIAVSLNSQRIKQPVNIATELN